MLGEIMPIEFKIDEDMGVLFSVASGTVNFSDFSDLRDRLRSHPNLRSGILHLSDFRAANVDLSGEEAQIVAQWFRNNRKVRKIAYVAHGAAYPFIRMVMGWTGDSNTIEVEVFEDLESAKSWLGLTQNL